MTDYRQFYFLEHYLFTKVRRHFHKNGRLNTFDFFCIIIWKSNRSKSREAKRILKHRRQPLRKAVQQLTSGIAKRQTAKERLSWLVEEWGFRLPMASAILTVLYPRQFTVYDQRVCDMLGNFHTISSRRFARLWAGYGKFKDAVATRVQHPYSLRNKDRYLWGKSFHDQLKRDIRGKLKRKRQ